MNAKTLSMLLGTSVLVAVGFGCGPQNSPVSLDKYQVAQPATSTQPVDNTILPPENIPTSSTALPPEVMSTTTPEATPATTTTDNSLIKSEAMPESQPETLAFPGVLPDAQTANKQIRIKTAKGDIVFELLPKEGPNAASNFVYLINHKFYDGLKFHRVEPGFVIQGGDPLSRNDDPRVGTGGPGYKFADDKVNLPYNKGIVAMANSGANTNGSQFFIMLDNTNLPPSYSVFGRVTSGLDVVSKIAVGDVMDSVTLETLKK